MRETNCNFVKLFQTFEDQKYLYAHEVLSWLRTVEYIEVNYRKLLLEKIIISWVARLFDCITDSQM